MTSNGRFLFHGTDLALDGLCVADGHTVEQVEQDDSDEKEECQENEAGRHGVDVERQLSKL